MTQDHKPDVRSVTPVVSVVVPARNEEAGLERCLRSLVEQQGIPFELLIVNDGSTDRTAEIIEKFADVKECPFLGVNSFLSGVRALEAPPLQPAWTGKANAVWVAARQARGEWILFTDADTVHEHGSLARAVAEAQEHRASLLSYSPHQDLETVPERMLMPLVFSELATTFRPREVCDPESPTAAANGQYLLVRRDVYLAIGGHQAISGEILEDVALARRVKQAGGVLRFRFGGDQVRARMYRAWDQLVEGWTKNLALLFKNARRLAWLRIAEFAALWGFLALVFVEHAAGHDSLAVFAGALCAVVWINFLLRVRRSHSAVINLGLSSLGLPLFAWLLLRSADAYDRGKIRWKGRTYSGSESTGVGTASVEMKKPASNGRLNSTGPSS